MTPHATSLPLKVTVEQGRDSGSGMWGHVVVLRRGTKQDGDTAYMPIEIGCVALVVACADVYLLAISHGFPVALRDVVRGVGGLIAAAIVIWLGFMVFAFALGTLINAVIDDSTGKVGLGRVVPRLAVGLVGVAAGVGDGALAALYGPISVASMALALGFAGYLRRSDAYRRRRHAAASMVLTFLCCYAVSGVLVAIYVLTRG